MRHYTIRSRNMPELAHLYRGRAGQMAVMSEFLDRGYNVAVPEVDIGDDIFVVRDSSEEYSRIQVKTSNATCRRYGTSAQFSLRLSQLQRPIPQETWYVFVRRSVDRWRDFLLIRQPELYDYHQARGMGSRNKKGNVILLVRSEGNRTICSGGDLSRHV